MYFINKIFKAISIDRLMSITSVVFPNIFILFIGNYFSYINIEISDKAVALMLIYLITSNWMGLQDYFLLYDGRIYKVIKKVIFDTSCIILCSYVIGSIYYKNNIILLVGTSISSYYLYFITALLRSNTKYVEAAFICILLSMGVTYSWFHNSNIFLLAVVTFELLIIITILYLNENKTSNSIDSVRQQPILLYVYAFVGSIFFGEIDRYILSYVKSSDLGFFYTSINFIILLPLLYYTSSIAYMINRFKHEGVIKSNKKILIMLVFSTGAGLIYLITIGEGKYLSGGSLLMILSIFLKSLTVAFMLSAMVMMYSIGEYKKIIFYNYTIGVVQLLVSLMLVFDYEPFLIISIGRIISAGFIIFFIQRFYKLIKSKNLKYKVI